MKHEYCKYCNISKEGVDTRFTMIKPLEDKSKQMKDFTKAMNLIKSIYAKKKKNCGNITSFINKFLNFFFPHLIWILNSQ